MLVNISCGLPLQISSKASCKINAGRESPGQSTVNVTLERAGAQIMDAVDAAPEAQPAKRARLEGHGTSGKLVLCDIIVVSQLKPAGTRQEMQSLLRQVNLRSSAAIKKLMPQNAKSNRQICRSVFRGHTPS